MSEPHRSSSARSTTSFCASTRIPIAISASVEGRRKRIQIGYRSQEKLIELIEARDGAAAEAQWIRHMKNAGDVWLHEYQGHPSSTSWIEWTTEASSLVERNVQRIILDAHNTLNCTGEDGALLRSIKFVPAEYLFPVIAARSSGLPDDLFPEAVERVASAFCPPGKQWLGIRTCWRFERAGFIAC